MVARTRRGVAEWNAWLAGLADVLGPLLLDRPARRSARTPPATWPTWRAWPGGTAALDVRTIADVTRLMTMSIADLLDDWFESPQVKGALAVNGVIGTWAGPYEPGTAYVMAHHSIGDVGDGQLGSWGFPEGGMGARVRGDPPLGASRSAPRCAPTPGSSRLLVDDGRVTAPCSTNGDGAAARRSS